jgi:hypothetical protein
MQREAVRWNIKVSKEADLTLRTFLDSGPGVRPIQEREEIDLDIPRQFLQVPRPNDRGNS